MCVFVCVCVSAFTHLSVYMRCSRLALSTMPSSVAVKALDIVTGVASLLALPDGCWAVLPCCGVCEGCEGWAASVMSEMKSERG